LVALNGPEKQTIWINPEEVVSVRAPRDSQSEHFPPSVMCVLQTVDGKLVAVVDQCEDVRRKLAAK
jgi:hypothetical protein